LSFCTHLTTRIFRGDQVWNPNVSKKFSSRSLRLKRAHAAVLRLYAAFIRDDVYGQVVAFHRLAASREHRISLLEILG
jgi:hypothetical protein